MNAVPSVLEKERVLVLAGHNESLVNFRGVLLQAMKAEGCDVHVAAPDLLADENLCRTLRSWGVVPHDVPIRRAGLNPLADMAALLHICRLMRAVRPSAFLGYTIKPVIYGNIAAWLMRVPHRFALITGLGYAFTGEATGKRALIKRLARQLYAFALRRASKVFFQNPDDEALFRKEKLLPEFVPSVVVNGSGVDTAHFALEPLPANAPSFLLIGRIIGDKGVREFAEAARKVKTLHSQARFALVGWVDVNPDAVKQSELDAWMQSGTLEHWGKLADVRPAIAKNSVYVLPSYREGTPRSVLEAMSMGRPVITTDAPGCRETVVDGDNGFLVPVRDANALAAAMLKFIEQPELIERMGRRSREIAEQKYDVHKVNDVMLKAMGIR